jgi:hypothetical protein
VIDSFSEDQVAAFDRDGFVIVEKGLVSPRALELLRERYEPLFQGVYETGIKPDEVNWVPGRDPEDRTRQICNGWRADTVIAAQVLGERTGRLGAQLARYRGTRILQDNVLWKPPGTKAIGFHQDSSYADYLVPAEMLTCWISLHETTADAGPIEYVRGSHLWPKSPPERSQFHAPEDWLAPARNAAPEGAGLDLVPVVVQPGGGSFHHGLTWHGSAPNTNASVARMALVTHMLPVEVRFHETNVDLIYSRYKRQGDLALDESFFPVLWDETGYRTPWLAALPDRCLRILGKRFAQLRPRDHDARRLLLRCDRRHPARPRVEHLDLPDQRARAESQRSSRTLHEHRARDEEHQRVRDLAPLHQRVPRHEAHLMAAGQQLVEKPARQPREQLRLADHPLVATAVEEQGLTLPVAGVLHVAEEERVIAAPVGADDPRHEVRQRPLDEWRLAHHEELGRDALGTAPGKEVGEPGLALRQHADTEPVPLVQQAAHATAAVERDEHEGRAQRDRHEGVRRHPVHLLADPRRQHRDSGREHPERTAKGDRRVAVEIADVDLVRGRDVVEGRVAEALERTR